MTDNVQICGQCGVAATGAETEPKCRECGTLLRSREMKFVIRPPDPPETIEPEIQIWQEQGADGLIWFARAANDKGRVSAVLCLNSDGTLYRVGGVSSHLGFELDSAGRIIDSTVEA